MFGWVNTKIIKILIIKNIPGLQEVETHKYLKIDKLSWYRKRDLNYKTKKVKRQLHCWLIYT